MGITKFIESVCVQPVVYWEPIGKDQYGKDTFYVPIEITCRWESLTAVEQQAFNRGPGEAETVSAKILIPQDVKVGGYLWLGTLAHLLGESGSGSSGTSSSFSYPSYSAYSGVSGSSAFSYPSTHSSSPSSSSSSTNSGSAPSSYSGSLSSSVSSSSFGGGGSSSSSSFSSSAGSADEWLVHPENILGAVRIKKVDRIPLFKSKTEWVRTAYV